MTEGIVHPRPEGPNPKHLRNVIALTRAILAQTFGLGTRTLEVGIACEVCPQEININLNLLS